MGRAGADNQTLSVEEPRSETPLKARDFVVQTRGILMGTTRVFGGNSPAGPLASVLLGLTGQRRTATAFLLHAQLTQAAETVTQGSLFLSQLMKNLYERVDYGEPPAEVEFKFESDSQREWFDFGRATILQYLAEAHSTLANEIEPSLAGFLSDPEKVTDARAAQTQIALLHQELDRIEYALDLIEEEDILTLN